MSVMSGPGGGGIGPANYDQKIKWSHLRGDGLGPYRTCLDRVTVVLTEQGYKPSPQKAALAIEYR